MALHRPVGRGYLRACQDNVPQALRLYEWNASVSSATFEILADVEIVTRNSIHVQLRLWHEDFLAAQEYGAQRPHFSGTVSRG